MFGVPGTDHFTLWFGRQLFGDEVFLGFAVAQLSIVLPLLLPKPQGLCQYPWA
jgi:hypothetical protein